MPSRFTGLVAAPFTPFRSDLAVNLAAIAPYARLLEANGVAAVFVCGTTGEGPSLTVAERRAVAEEWMRVAGQLRVIVHVGHNSLPAAQELTAHAEQVGAAAVGLLSPFFFKPRDNAELVDWCQRVAAAAPRTPFYYYQIPSMTGVSLPVAEFLALAEPMIPTLAGVKFTYEDLNDFAACVAYGQGKYDILFGRDEILIEGLRLSAKGAVGSTYNYAGPLYRRLIEAYEAGDIAQAQAWQKTAVRMIEICAGVGVTHLAASKSLMALAGVDCGPPRPPVAAPSAAQHVELRRRLEAIGYFDFSARAVSR